MSFAILSCANKDAARWQSLIDQLPLEYRDVLFTPAYARVQQSIGQGPCFAAVYQWQEFFILQPFMQRGQELVSFYGGGGPISNLMDGACPRLWLWFDYDFAEWRKACKITGEYVRLHPLFDKGQRRMLRESTVKLEHLREAVNVKIDMDDEKLLKSLSRNRQRGINGAEEQGVFVERSNSADSAEKFAKLYQASMERLQAAQVWCFPDQVWWDYQFELGDEYCSFHIARVGPDTKAMLLMIHGYERSYAHFLAADGPPGYGGVNDLLYFESMKYCRDIGCKTYFLGGGTTSNADDPLLQYKSGFSKDRVPVYFYKRTFSEVSAHADSLASQPA